MALFPRLALAFRGLARPVIAGHLRLRCGDHPSPNNTRGRELFGRKVQRISTLALVNADPRETSFRQRGASRRGRSTTSFPERAPGSSPTCGGGGPSEAWWRGLMSGRRTCPSLSQKSAAREARRSISAPHEEKANIQHLQT